MTQILAINGAYRAGGITDQAIDVMVHSLRQAGTDVEVISLRDYPIEFCRNCRACTQSSGPEPGHCIQDDGMQALIEKIEQADGYIMAAPTNFNTVTAIFKRFMERLVVYADWPWGTNTPKFRKRGNIHKKAVLISSSAAPAIMGRWLFTSCRQLKVAAKTVGAKSVGTLFTGLIADEAEPHLSDRAKARAARLALKLA
jgi:multimeric flavodoxin WrbA